MTGGMIRKAMARGCPIALIAAAVAVLATGCGGATRYTRAQGGRVEVALDEYRVVPQYIQVRPGRVTIVAHDEGRLTHNLEVVAFRRPLTGRPERRFGRRIRTLFPGGSDSTTIRLKPGKYRLICTLANHDRLGQYAELKVGP
jgi:hypothetical protein